MGWLRDLFLPRRYWYNYWDAILAGKPVVEPQTEAALRVVASELMPGFRLSKIQPDWRSAARACNIETSDVTGEPDA